MADKHHSATKDGAVKGKKNGAVESEADSAVMEDSVAKKRSSQYDGILILTLLVVVLSGFIWVVVFSGDDPGEIARMAQKQRANSPKAGPTPLKIVKNIVSSVVAVPSENGSLKVRFNTSKPAMCEIAVGYNPANPKYKEVGGYAHEMKHTLIARELLPGKVYFIISGKLKDGSVFKEPVGVSEIPAPGSGPGLVARNNVVDSGTENGVSDPDSSTAVDSGTQEVSDVDEVTSGYDEAVAGNNEEKSDGFARDSKGNVVYIAPISKADPEARLENLAKGISALTRKHGPASLTNLKREELEKHIEYLKAEFEKYEDARGACELGEAYFEYKSYRKALFYATKGSRIDSNHINSHKLRLKVFRKFGMGAKIQETQAKIMALASPEERAALKPQFDLNTKLFGKFIGLEDKKPVYAK